MLTATAAGTLLGALWFVPSANATGENTTEVRTQTVHTSTSAVLQSGAEVSASGAGTSRTNAEQASAELPAGTTRLADTGSFDTTPYVVGGTLFLSLGAGFVTYSVRRERMGEAL
ncbi:hypothetical protein GCM10010515_02280 [Streptomyces fructofermentans]|uniref:Gram-positive cocci surface proteins LPxTG domain-containing protein n=1 Tax=Streptomyces fructofermentans TaxID=152141 RepID=A0A918K122_9ACTN|nr:hypothetical protein GCM10010515_02280 [Streptomyces fructofermentans]